jgi:hypothetical protein
VVAEIWACLIKEEHVASVLDRQWHIDPMRLYLDAVTYFVCSIPCSTDKLTGDKGLRLSLPIAFRGRFCKLGFPGRYQRAMTRSLAGNSCDFRMISSRVSPISAAIV